MKRNTFLKSLGLLAAGIVSGNKIMGAAKKSEKSNESESSEKDVVIYGDKSCNPEYIPCRVAWADESKTKAILIEDKNGSWFTTRRGMKLVNDHQLSTK